MFSRLKWVQLNLTKKKPEMVNILKECWKIRYCTAIDAKYLTVNGLWAHSWLIDTTQKVCGQAFVKASSWSSVAPKVLLIKFLQICCSVDTTTTCSLDLQLGRSSDKSVLDSGVILRSSRSRFMMSLKRSRGCPVWRLPFSRTPFISSWEILWFGIQLTYPARASGLWSETPLCLSSYPPGFAEDEPEAWCVKSTELGFLGLVCSPALSTVKENT